MACTPAVAHAHSISISDSTMNVVLLGQNIAHSLSPFLHNTLFRRHRLPFVYDLLPIAASELPSAVEVMKRGGYAGANVTSPHKELLFRLVDTRDPIAERVRAVNTVVFRDGAAAGYNTDVQGFRWSLESTVDGGIGAFRTAAMLGTGGAARAAIAALLDSPNLKKLTLYSRALPRAVAEAARWNDPRIIPAQIEHFTPAELVVNATPVGLAADAGSTDIFGGLFGTGSARGQAGEEGGGDDGAGDDDRAFRCQLFYDMIYRPATTSLMAIANRAGVPAMNGLRMFAAQAAESFRLWTGVDASPAELHNLLQDHLQNDLHSDLQNDLQTQ
ncbi:MAG: shikimate dehydrogenase [Chlorobi bacterium CHB2]|nr:shikimate dehydrogenase [Chlorobi bacterium CHB2]